MKSLAALLVLVLGLGTQAAAQVILPPSLPLPPPSPPPPPVNVTAQALHDAYTAVVRSKSLQANFLYAEALARYRAGDRTSATYDAALAAGMANAVLGRTYIAPIGAAPPPDFLLQAKTIPLPAVLPTEVLRARNEIERVQQLTGDPLSAATARYRAALDRYFAGDVAGAKSEADAAYASAVAAAKNSRQR